MPYEPKPPRRTNKPRKSHYKHLFLYAIHAGIVYTEDGEKMPLAEWLTRLDEHPRALCISHKGPHTLKQITDLIGDTPGYNARLRSETRERHSHRDPNKKVTQTQVQVVSFGIYNQHRGCRTYRIRHLILDPDTFLRLPKYARPHLPNDPQMLLAFGRALREWCKVNDLPLMTSGSALACGLLKDRRFLRDATRKIPRELNEATRPALTGHMFYTRPKLKVYEHLYKLDQKRSHHQCAAELTFPDPNSIHASGYYRTLARAAWTTYDRLAKSHGVIYCRINVRQLSPFHATLSTLGKRHVYLTTNEVPYLLPFLRIEYVAAAWTTPRTHDALNLYASWAMADLDVTPGEHLWWKKPLLLAPYGLLGIRPQSSITYAQTKPIAAPRRRWHVGGGATMLVYPYTFDYGYEPTFTNVVARAMIERESRARTATRAHELENTGYEVVCIDADAILFRLRDGLDLPEPGPYWKLSRLDHVAIEGRNLVSDQVIKLPGIPGTFRERFVDRLRRLIREPEQERLGI